MGKITFDLLYDPNDEVSFHHHAMYGLLGIIH